MTTRLPILLSFYALSNGHQTMIFGQLTYTRLKDVSFKDYNSRKTFRTLFSLYRTRPYAAQKIILVFDDLQVEATTNSHGAFFEKYAVDLSGRALQKVILPTGQEVKVMEGLYQRFVHRVRGDVVVVSDIDDTLLHSFITRRVLKFRTLLFTSVEKRRAVTNMQALMNHFVALGAEPFYLSNSEQNLHPLIYRFLIHNQFPQGPLFLKQMRKLKHVLFNLKFPPKNIHKTTMLEELLTFLPDKRFVLMGDNTQYDLSIYLSIVHKFGSRINAIIIRKVTTRTEDQVLIDNARELLNQYGIQLYYASEFPIPFLR